MPGSCQLCIGLMCLCVGLCSFVTRAHDEVKGVDSLLMAKPVAINHLRIRRDYENIKSGYW